MVTDFSTWRVLAVDDEPDNLNLLADLLEYQGAAVFRAQNGQQGLEAVDQFGPNVILLDLAMPGLDGWQMHRLLRTRTDLARIPIIAISALAMPEDLERAKDAGFDGYITKPYRIKALIEELAACVEPFINHRREAPSHPA